MRHSDSTGSGRVWDAWHAAHDAVVSHTTSSAQAALSMGGLAFAGSIWVEIGHVAASLAEKVVSTVVVTAAVTATGFFVSRYLNKRFTPTTPTPPIPRDPGT